MAKFSTTLAALASLAFGAWFVGVEFDSAGISVVLALTAMSMLLSLFAAVKATSSAIPKEARYAGFIALVMAALVFILVFFRWTAGGWSSISLGYVAVAWLLLHVPMLLALVRAPSFYPVVAFMERMKERTLPPSDYRQGVFDPLVGQLATMLKVRLDYEYREDMIAVGSASCVATQMDPVLGASFVQVLVRIDIDVDSADTATADVMMFSDGQRLKCRSDKSGDFMRFVWQAEGETKQWESRGWLPDSTGKYEQYRALSG